MVTAEQIIYAAMTDSEKREANKFFGGRESTRTQRDNLRSVLVGAESAKPEMVATLRAYFNLMASEGISSANVTAAIRALEQR